MNRFSFTTNPVNQPRISCNCNGNEMTPTLELGTNAANFAFIVLKAHYFLCVLTHRKTGTQRPRNGSKIRRNVLISAESFLQIRLRLLTPLISSLPSLVPSANKSRVILVLPSHFQSRFAKMLSAFDVVYTV